MPTLVPGTLPAVTLMDPGPRWISSTCRLVPGLEETYVYIGDALFAILPEGDAYSAKFAAAHLVQLHVASAEAIARAFGFPSTSLREWVAQLRRTGTLTPSDFKPGPVGPRKMTPEIFRYLETHSARSDWEMAAQIEQQFGVKISPHTLRWYRRHQPAAEPSPSQTLAQPEFTAVTERVAPSSETESTPEVPLEADREPEASALPVVPEVPEVQEPAAEEASTALAVPDLPVLPSDQSVVAAGFLVLAPYFTQLGLGEWTAAHPWTEDHQFAPLTILLAWVLAFLLGARSAEATKLAPREDWGWVIGADHYPHPDTLRSISQEWTRDHLGPNLAAHCGPRYLALFPEAPALIYLDGHFVPYSGHAAYPGKGYSTLKRLVIPGHEQFWVHDGQGHPLWVDEAAGDASFYTAIQRISERVQAWHTGRLLVVYDRGGVSEDTARFLVEHDMDFLCYGKARTVPKTVEWSEITLVRGGKERTYQIGEHVRAWGKLSAVREIWVRDGKHPIPVLTSQADRSPGELLLALWGRWQQENSFKLLVQDYGLNHFGDRDTTPLDNRPMVNPERTRLARQLAQLDQKLGGLRRRYPPTAEAPAALPATAPKIAHTRWAQLQSKLTAVVAAYEAAPETVPLWDLVPEDRRRAFTFHNKAFQDACRVIAINGEHWLRQQVAPLYPNPRHERPLMRWLLQARGRITYREGTIEIALARPPRPRWAGVIEELLARVNAMDPRYPAHPDFRLQFSLQPPRKWELSVKIPSGEV
ncbi:MAG: hypothetical protein M1415_00570 [Firmicutes bacterium]|nr:hypothetical protein [Bacillota bacterium]MCL5064212.1 hypothetical protein [Bacillota bacterium]